MERTFERSFYRGKFVRKIFLKRKDRLKWPANDLIGAQSFLSRSKDRLGLKNQVWEVLFSWKYYLRNQFSGQSYFHTIASRPTERTRSPSRRPTWSSTRRWRASAARRWSGSPSPFTQSQLSRKYSRARLQSGASYHSQGFEDNVLGSSSGWLADTVATYCPGRPSQLT